MHSKPEGWWTYPFIVVVRGENLGMRLAGYSYKFPVSRRNRLADSKTTSA